MPIVFQVAFFYTQLCIFHAKMGSIKDRNGMDLTEAEILRRGGKNTWKKKKKRIHGRTV